MAKITSFEDINNAQGKLVANKDLHLDAKGLVDNTSGQLTSQNNLTIKSGKLENQFGNIATNNIIDVVSHEILNNKGNIQGESILLSGQDFSNYGQLYAKKNLNIAIDKVLNDGVLSSSQDIAIKSSLFSQGIHGVSIAGLNNTVKYGNLNILSQNIIARGILEATNRTTITTQDILNLEHSQISAQDITLTSKQSDLSTAQAQVQSKGQLTLSASHSLNNQQGQLQANQISVSGDSLNNQQGQLLQLGQTAQSIQLSQINNEQGQIKTNATDLSVQSTQLNNQSGVIVHAGKGQLEINSRTLDGARGNIASEGHLSVQGQNIDLNHAKTQALGIDITADTLNHDSGELLQTDQSQQLKIAVAQGLNNQSGRLVGLGDVSVNSHDLNNQQGTLQSGKTLGLTSVSLNNQHGLIDQCRNKSHP
ncbi:hypothetical protein [Acinetobacter rathckeae]